jgi:hypothetical protein
LNVPVSGLAGGQRLALMRVELGFDNSLSLVDIERLELRTTRFTDAIMGTSGVTITFAMNTCFIHATQSGLLGKKATYLGAYLLS